MIIPLTSAYLTRYVDRIDTIVVTEWRLVINGSVSDAGWRSWTMAGGQ